jgi:hypothetical protein
MGSGDPSGTNRCRPILPGIKTDAFLDAWIMGSPSSATMVDVPYTHVPYSRRPGLCQRHFWRLQPGPFQERGSELTRWKYLSLCCCYHHECRSIRYRTYH